MNLHLLANAHLDPVWLWDWREGMNEGLQTVRTIVTLMDQDQDLTFIRGESLIYRHIEQNDPQTFSRIVQLVQEGRWDVVGGSFLQADNNLPATESLLRQFIVGQDYFSSRFGKPVRAAWSADAFGHSAGLPEILAAAEIEYFAFTRPAQAQLQLREPAFWWEGAGGAKILSYRSLNNCYQTERKGIAEALNYVVKKALQGSLTNVGFFYGLGNHGGGPSRAQLREIQEWSRLHPEINIIHSGLHPFFDALREELREKGEDLIPTHRGELGHCLRGCYSSAARLKFAYRKAEAHLGAVEKTGAAIDAYLGNPPARMDQAWEELLFMAFHDILPGTAIERALDEQMAWLGSIELKCQRAGMKALNSIGRLIDTTTILPGDEDHPTPVPVLVWNPHPFSFNGYTEVEVCLDYRPLWDYRNRADEVSIQILGSKGKSMRFQEIETEHRFMTDLPWRKRFVVPVTIPPMGWEVLQIGWVKGAVPVAFESDLKAHSPGTIENAFYRVTASVGESGVQVYHQGRPLFGPEGLGLAVFEDPWGSWGGLGEEHGSTDIDTIRETWSVVQLKILEQGPERVRLWVKFAGKSSTAELVLSLYQGCDAVDVQARVFWSDRQARLKLIMPVGDKALYEVPGGSVMREPLGEAPGGRWVQISKDGHTFAFASDSLYGFDCKNGAFRATVVRSAGYATDGASPSEATPWYPVQDMGELKFHFLFQGHGEGIRRRALELEQPPMVLMQPASAGPLPKSGSLVKVEPESVTLLALTPAKTAGDWIIRLQSPEKDAARVVVTWLGDKMNLGSLPAGKIMTWRICRNRDEDRWSTESISALEFQSDLEAGSISLDVIGSEVSQDLSLK